MPCLPCRVNFGGDTRIYRNRGYPTVAPPAADSAPSLSWARADRDKSCLVTMTASVPPSGDAGANGESTRRVMIGILALQVRKHNFESPRGTDGNMTKQTGLNFLSGNTTQHCATVDTTANQMYGRRRGNNPPRSICPALPILCCVGKSHEDPRHHVVLHTLRCGV